MFIVGKIASAGTVALGLAGYLGVFAPGIPPRWIATAAVIVFTALNALGVRRSSQANIGIVAISVGALLVFVGAGIPSFDAANLRPFAPAGWSGAVRAAALLFFAYTGYARIATLGEEVRDPARTIPRAVVITIAIAVVLYSAVALVAVGLAGAPTLAASPAPLHAAAAQSGVAWLAPVVAAGGIAAMLGVILSQLLGLSRMAYAMARRGDLPRALAHVSARTAVPVRAILLIGAVAAVIAATGTLAGVAAAASFTILVYYGIANLAALRMPAELKRFSDLVPAVGLVACVLLAFALPVRTIAIGVGLLVAGFAGRALLSRLKR
jgi:APA family basic amino acid/polyamine antiporter